MSLCRHSAGSVIRPSVTFSSGQQLVCGLKSESLSLSARPRPLDSGNTRCVMVKYLQQIWSRFASC